jgi:hypothetical protein
MTMHAPLRLAALIAAMALATPAWAADGASSPAKKELIAKIVTHQQGLGDALASSLVQQPIGQLVQAGRAALAQVPADKREAVAKAMDAEVKKFVEENVAYLKDKASKTVPATSAALLDEKFNEDELKQILAWAESPVSKKFGLYNAELQKASVDKLLGEAGPTLDGRLKTLQLSLAKQLGLPAPGTAPAAKPAASAPAKK